MNTTPRPTASEKLCAGQIESAPISQRSLATGLRSSAVSASFIIAINEIRRRQSADFVAFFYCRWPRHQRSTVFALTSCSSMFVNLKKRETQLTDGGSQSGVIASHSTAPSAALIDTNVATNLFAPPKSKSTQVAEISVENVIWLRFHSTGPSRLKC